MRCNCRPAGRRAAQRAEHVMLYNDAERELMAGAIQPNLRKPNVRVKPFETIVEDFLAKIDISGSRVLDIGPGHCNFLDLMRALDARTFGVDFDPAVVQLGRMRGHEMLHADLLEGWPYPGRTFDGIFCRGSIDCFRFGPDIRTLKNFLDAMAGALAAGGWLWIAPWSSPDSFTGTDLEDVPATVDAWAAAAGVTVAYPNGATAQRYGIGYKVPQIAIWTKNCAAENPD
jgi:hypothetical protein